MRCAELDVHTPNRSGLPIIEVPLRDHTRIDAVGRLLFERGVYVTLAAYPLVPKAEVGFRMQLTAANTDAEVDALIDAVSRARASAASCSPPPTQPSWRRPDELPRARPAFVGETRRRGERSRDGRAAGVAGAIWPSARSSPSCTCWSRRSRAARC